MQEKLNPRRNSNVVVDQPRTDSRLDARLSSAPAALITRKAFLQFSVSALVSSLFGSLAVPRPTLAAPSEFRVVEIADGVFVHQGRHALFNPENKGDIANAAFVIGRDGVAVIDTGGSAFVGRQLRKQIRALTSRPVRYVINTHMHPDHVFGNAAFTGEHVDFIAHHKMSRGLTARAERYLALNKELLGPEAFEGTQIIMPTREISEATDLDLGDRKLRLLPQPTAHTDNDLLVRDDRTSTLFLGDLLFSGHVPTLDGSIKGWLSVLSELTSDDAARVVPGHGPATMEWPNALEPQRRYLNAVVDDVRRMIAEGRSLSEASSTAALSEQDAWKLFSEYHARTVSAAYAELEWE